MEKEEGEISESEGAVSYVPFNGPETSRYRNVQKHFSSSDEDYSYDSDCDDPILSKKRKVSRPTYHMETDGIEISSESVSKDTLENKALTRKPFKRNTIWANVIQEQVLSQEIGGVGLKSYLKNSDRSVESYDYVEAKRLLARNMDCVSSDEELEDKKDKRLSRKRPAKNRIKIHPEGSDKPRHLDGFRRRTSGGIYLHLVKQFAELSKEQLGYIFPEDNREKQRKRKRFNRRKRKGKEELPVNDVVEDHFSDNSGGTKCPGSTPATTPHNSDVEGEIINKDNLDIPNNFVDCVRQQSLPKPLECCSDDFLEITVPCDSMDVI